MSEMWLKTNIPDVSSYFKWNHRLSFLQEGSVAPQKEDGLGESDRRLNRGSSLCSCMAGETHLSLKLVFLFFGNNRIPFCSAAPSMCTRAVWLAHHDRVYTSHRVRLWVSTHRVCGQKPLSYWRSPRAFLVPQLVKSLPVTQETQVQPLGQEHPLEKGMATHSSILAWRIPWTEESVG